MHTGKTGPNADLRLALMRLAEDGSSDPSARRRSLRRCASTGDCKGDVTPRRPKNVGEPMEGVASAALLMLQAGRQQSPSSNSSARGRAPSKGKDP